VAGVGVQPYEEVSRSLRRNEHDIPEPDYDVRGVRAWRAHSCGCASLGVHDTQSLLIGLTLLMEEEAAP
jgi:hypothetical protein